MSKLINAREKLLEAIRDGRVRVQQFSTGFILSPEEAELAIKADRHDIRFEIMREFPPLQ